MSKTAFEVAASQPWAIKPDALEQILTIAAGYGDDPDALAARLGRPLQNAREVTMHGDGVAVIPITGPIFHRANLFTQISGATSTELLAQDLTSAIDDPDIKSILLDIDSPGGQMAGISELADMIHASSKPVAAYVGAAGASGAYWLASAADVIAINNTALVGSIGVVMSATTDKNSKRIEIVSSGAPKKRVDISTDDGRAEIQTLVDRLEVEFVGAVARFRNISTNTVRSDFGQGGLLVGTDAQAAGMVDQISNFETVIAGLSGQTAGAGSMSTKPAAGDKNPAITLSMVVGDHPDIAEALRAEGAAARDADISSARSESAEGERARIQAVFDQGAKLPGHDALISRLMFDGKTTGPEAAVEILAAESALRGQALDDIKSGAPPVAPPANAPDVGGDPSAPVEERCKAEWNKSPDIRGEFQSLDAFISYTRAIETGRVKILKRA